MGKEESTKKEVHIGLTGHRPHKLWGYNLDKPEYNKLQDKLEDIIETLLYGYDKVVCHTGLALGADSIWSIAILNMREKYPDKVFLHAEIPFLGQASKWYGEDVEFWKYQVATADSKSLYLDYEEDTSWDTVAKWVITKALDDRNKGMVDAVDVLIAIYDDTPSGTKNAVDYAKKQHKKVLAYHPDKFK